jgi:bifunctional ADP-heptose synthase (sugar kinase/adenylyltransferase)
MTKACTNLQNLKQRIYQKIKALITRFKINVIIFEDYDKGALNATVINEVIKAAQTLGISTTVDPKRKTLWLIKCNLI